MIRLANVIDTFKADFLAQYRHKLSSDHLRALSALTRCRTQASLKMQVQCQGCDHQVLMPHSCGHRHCPHCQHHESEQWLKRQIGRLVSAIAIACRTRWSGRCSKRASPHRWWN